MRLFSLLLAVGLAFLPWPANAQPSAAALDRTNAALVPVPRTDETSRQRFDELLQRVKAIGPDAEVVFVGDSITRRWETDGKAVWDKYYAPRKALNLGIGGDRTQNVLWRLEHGQLDTLKPKVVVLMIGTNNSNREDHSPGEILEGVTVIVHGLRQRLPDAKILLLGIFPRGTTFSAQRGKLLQVNQALAKLDDGQKVFFLDIGAEFIEADGGISKAVMPDALHLSSRGYELWAAAMEPKLAQLLGTTPGAGSAFAGEWVWKMRGPNGEDVEGPLLLKVDGGKVSGEFRTDAGRALPIREGSIEGQRINLVVTRNRPQGGDMTYRMTGTLTGATIEGTATTEFNGNPVTMPWSARRK